MLESNLMDFDFLDPRKTKARLMEEFKTMDHIKLIIELTNTGALNVMAEYEPGGYSRICIFTLRFTSTDEVHAYVFYHREEDERDGSVTTSFDEMIDHINKSILLDRRFLNIEE